MRIKRIEREWLQVLSEGMANCKLGSVPLIIIHVRVQSKCQSAVNGIEYISCALY
jgi:hypothetical protein